VNRFTVANMLVLVGVLGVGMAAMRDGSDESANALFSAVIVALLVSLLGAIVRRDAAWTGFSVFGWGYMGLAFFPGFKDEIRPHLLTTPLVNKVVEELLHVPKPIALDHAAFLEANPAIKEQMRQYKPEQLRLDYLESRILEARMNYFTARNNTKAKIDPCNRIGHAIFALVFGLIGACAGRFLASWRMCRETSRSSTPESVSESSS
jgi:hypothetical protein